MDSQIALIEDDPAIATMIRKVLALEGLHVTVLSDGISGLRALETGSFDAVILDATLPGKDGVSVMREVRSNPITQRLPVVMLTGKADRKSTSEGWKAGCDLYMTKPFDPEELVRVLRTMLH